MDYEAAAEQALSELQQTGIEYSADIFNNAGLLSNDSKWLSAFQKAIKDTYGVDTVIHNGFVFLTAEDANTDSEFTHVYGCLFDELIDISNAVTRRLDEGEEDDTDIIQKEFDVSRQTSRILNIVGETHEVVYDEEAEEDYLAYSYAHKETGLCDDVMHILDKTCPELLETLYRPYIEGEVAAYVDKQIERAKLMRHFAPNKENLFESTTEQLRDAEANAKEIEKMLVNNCK
ncbi:TPA: hypothetical protein JG855_002034 [Vibrio parahaemolyticus]|uniref:hypothetical protein n=1 Tax=Vibrio alginolyticus TaxID=663 RepID=UPI001302F6C3|nr:hypothetical protein [Vibrio alginolyticus]MCG6354813.1 hypothetical protein [Vibrio alginolyticus]HAV1497944.1 hypothetical protein [Vibrio parahaemolyticus]HAV1503113.1 hypothetical protein [Vibrio parahaemolyticus]HBL4682793.1 hypothetical protein [Vibrio parahaemolyticus]